MLRPEIVALVALGAVLIMMGAELVLSRANERILRRGGAIEPAGDVYRLLAAAYPGMFVAMAIEGIVGRGAPGLIVGVGVLVFALAKFLKVWAISTLGSRWTYRVLVPPGAPLVSTGPYAWMRHPNYAAVFGEIAGIALIVGAPLTGVLSLATFGLLVKARIGVEEKALGRHRTSVHDSD